MLATGTKVAVLCLGYILKVNLIALVYGFCEGGEKKKAYMSLYFKNI